jgi:putative transcriptional regulator
VTKPPSPARSAHLDEQLVEAALGAPGSPAHAQVGAHLAECARCRKRFAALQEALAVAALSRQATPPRAVRDNILLAIGGPRPAGLPYPGFAARLGQLYHLDADQMRAILHKSADAAQWENQGPISLLHFSAGASLPGTHAGFLRLLPGLRFPRHRHVGQEVSLILSGAIRDEDSGVVQHPGDLLVMAPGSEHAFVAVPPHECVIALLLYESWPHFTGS